MAIHILQFSFIGKESQSIKLENLKNGFDLVIKVQLIRLLY